jgi:hypothetical protein
MNPNDSFVVDDDDNRRISAASSSSNDSKSSANSRSSNSSNGNVKIQQKRKMSSRPSTAPVKKQSSSSSSSSHRASTAPSKGSGNADDASSNVRVVARLRPLSTKEKNEINNVESIRANIHSSSIAILDNNDTTTLSTNNNNSRQFDFDAVFEPNSSQEEVYKKSCGDMITKSIFRGYNATILAYGQTGSGKTYTMGTSDYNGSSSTSPSSASGSELLTPPSKSEGVIGRAVYDLFATRNELPNGRNRVKIEMSFLEIYNEQAIDLLSDDSNNNSDLQVRDSKSEGGVIVQNLKSYVVNSPRMVYELMEKAGSKRATGSTQMNSVSSRSHAICTLTVTIAPLEEGGSSAAVASSGESSIPSPRDAMRAKLTLVDLAGSERIKRTGAEGARLKEGININKGTFVVVLCLCGETLKRSISSLTACYF